MNVGWALLMSAGASWTSTTEWKSLQPCGPEALGGPIRGHLTDSLYQDLPAKSSQLSLSQKWKLRIGGADRGQRVR